MSAGFSVDLAALEQAAAGVNGTLDELSQQSVSDIPHDSSAIGHERLASTVTDLRMEKPLSTVVDSLPARYRSVFSEVIGKKDTGLLTDLLSHEEPSRDERVAVMNVLSTEFSNHLRSDDEPTDRGRDIDNALGAFLTRWPIENE